MPDLSTTYLAQFILTVDDIDKQTHPVIEYFEAVAWLQKEMLYSFPYTVFIKTPILGIVRFLCRGSGGGLQVSLLGF